MALTSNIVFDVPGVYVTEDTYGVVPASLSSFGTVYMLGSSPNVAAPVDTITFIESLDDFTNVFGASPSAASVKLFFDQRSGSGIYFVNVGKRSQRTVTVPTVTTGATYSLIFDGTNTISVVALAGETPAALVARLANEVNTKLPGVAYMVGNMVNFVSTSVITATANITLGTAVAAGALPTAVDVAHSISIAFSPEMRQGYLIAPEFFQAFTVSTDRIILANAMEALASDANFNWCALLDASATLATSKAVGTVTNAVNEAALYSSPKGHSSYFFPYWFNTTNTAVPMSASVAGVAIRAYRSKGFTQPPAGVTFPVYGVVDATYDVTAKSQAVLNPVGVNCGRRLPNGRGTVIYGSRTLSKNPYYKFLTTRVIMNVLSGTLKNAFDEFIFSSVDGLGVLFSRVKLTCIAICEAMRSSGALFGATPAEAYLVVCDLTNNPALDLESGKVTVDVIVKPSPVLEALSVRVARASIGTSLSEAIASGVATEIPNTAKDSQPKGR